jgi:predicted dienelactone hydrolase
MFKKKRLKWLFYLAAPLIVLILPINGGLKLSRYFKTINLQPQKTGITTFHFHDAERNRPIVTEVWYPIDANTPAKASSGFWLRCDEARDAPLSKKQSKYPLIVMSHGQSCDRFTNSWLAEILAANGYIVAAMDHYGNTWNNKIPELYAQPWERPKDISFVLDQILSTSQFKDRIDRTRIGFAGYSLGGGTGLWIAGAEANQIDLVQIKTNCQRDLADVVSPELIEQIDFNKARGSFRDRRFSAMVIMAPALGWLFEEDSLKRISIPIYIFAPEKDQVVPTESNAMIFAKKISRASLKILPETNHYVFLNRTTVIGKRFLEPKYCEDPTTIDRKKVHEEIAKNTVLFFDEHLQKSHLMK